MKKSIIVVGGGSAGWMAAAWLGKKTQCKITVIESANIKHIGVGESTIPSIVDFFQELGITEQDLFEQCSAIRKYTIQHNGWNGAGDQWYHHFCFDESEHDQQLDWMRAYQVPTAHWRHAYHLDATKLGTMIRDRACRDLHIHHCVDDILDVNLNEHGVASLKGNKETYTADFYVDCTGFRSVLRSRLGSASVNHPALINDYALAGPGNYDGDQPLPYTQTFAMDHGWRWRVCLQHRTGNGYAFNKSFMSIDQAAHELLTKTPGLRAADIFEVPINNQYNPEPWKKNVVSLGLSCGFLEPLEATGLFLIHAPLKMLVPLLDDPRGQEKFNRVWRYLYDHIAEFLSMHFTTSKLNHTEYWRSFVRPERIKLPQTRQSLFDRYSYRQISIARGIPYA
jgi:tryptophan 7-halogenase